MKTIKIILILLVLSKISVIAQTNVNLTGMWTFSDLSDPATVFSLELFQNENNITGNHCSVMFNGDFIDCETPGEYAMFDGVSITGSIVNDTATVTFKSTYYCDDIGIARIVKINEFQISWQVITPPNCGYFIPNEAILTKE